MTDQTAVKSKFYTAMGWVFVAFIFAGFIPVTLMRYQSSGTFSPVLIAHGISYLGWFLLFIYQVSLVGKASVAQHQKVGSYSLFLTFFMVFIGTIMTLQSYAAGAGAMIGMTPEQFLMLPLLDMILFSVFYVLGIVHRRKAAFHKRYMLLAGLLIMDPAITRMAVFFFNTPQLGLVIHFGLLAAVFIHDKRSSGSFHSATIYGTGALIFRYAMIFGVSGSQAWANAVRATLG